MVSLARALSVDCARTHRHDPASNAGSKKKILRIGII